MDSAWETDANEVQTSAAETPTGAGTSTRAASNSDKSTNKACFSRFKYQLQSNLGAIIHEKEQHNTRLHNLRKELSHIKSTDWQYEPIEKLIGRGNNNHQ